LNGLECTVFRVQGKAQRRAMVIPLPSLVVATPPCARKTVQSGT